jgi:hypothetical protein
LIVGARLSASGFNFGSADFVPARQRQIGQWVMDIDSVMALASRRSATRPMEV